MPGEAAAHRHIMPLYEYQCDACGARFERIQKFSDPPIEQCPKCNGHVHKLLSSPAIQIKGTGWYVTDYAKSGSSKSGAGSKDGDGAKEGGGSKEGSGSKEGAAETKDAKPAGETSSSTKSTSDSKDSSSSTSSTPTTPTKS